MKILIIYATAGAGHRRAAESIYDGIRASTNWKVALIDALDYTNSVHKSFYSGSYGFLITSFPWLWGFVFWLANLPKLLPWVKKLRRGLHAVIAGKLTRFLKEGKFDCIITTHFLANEVVSHLKMTSKIHSKLITVVTDFDVHRFWLADAVDIYALASDWTKTKITQMGVADEKCVVTGIPIHAKFSTPKDKAEIRRRLGLQEGLFTALIATGSFGIGPIEEVIETAKGCQVIVVCGHNKDLFFRLNRMQMSEKSVKVLGLVNNMEELMAVSDLMISKPGGLSIAEALVNGLPLIFFNVIPGQEVGNVRVLKEYGIGIDSQNINDIKIALDHLKECPEDVREIKEKIKTLAKPNAVRDIISLVTN